MMPSMLPRIGAGVAPGVFYNTGHGHLGWTLSAATAEMVADSAAPVMLMWWLVPSPNVGKVSWVDRAASRVESDRLSVMRTQ